MHTQKPKKIKFKWPENKRFAACLSHDVDVPFKFNSIGTLKELKNNPKDSINILYKFIKKENPYWQFENIIRLENEFGFKSTFFFCAKRRHIKDPYYSIFNKDIVNIIRKLDNNGFEIGMHGSYLSYNNKEFLEEERNMLERVLNKKVLGNRQHFLNFNNNTAKFLSELGFVYDSTFGSSTNIGFLQKRYFPFFFWNLIEIPMNIMDAVVFNNFLTYENSWKQVKKLIDFAENKSCVITFNWHQRVFYEEEFKGYGKLYIKILECLKKKNVYVGRLCDIAKIFHKKNVRSQGN